LKNGGRSHKSAPRTCLATRSAVLALPPRATRARGGGGGSPARCDLRLKEARERPEKALAEICSSCHRITRRSTSKYDQPQRSRRYAAGLRTSSRPASLPADCLTLTS
jgi:hypothetical protein